MKYQVRKVSFKGYRVVRDESGDKVAIARRHAGTANCWRVSLYGATNRSIIVRFAKNIPWAVEKLLYQNS